MTQSLFDLTGKNAIVTGASSGLGRHFALTLAKAGARLAIAARRTEKLAELQEEIERHDGRAIPIAMDVLSPQSVKDGIVHAETELGSISILVNNAGIAVTKPFVEQSEEDWDRVVDTNLKGAFLVAQETARHMTAHGEGGSIINVASMLGLHGTGGVAAYCASKGGLINLTRAMAAELSKGGIRVNALAPGYIETDINRDFLASPAGENLRKRIPMRRFGQPGDLDGALLLLASDAGAFMTGAILEVDGGQGAVV